MVTANFRFPVWTHAPCPVLSRASVIVATRPPPGLNVTSALYQFGKSGVPGPSVIVTAHDPCNGSFEDFRFCLARAKRGTVTTGKMVISAITARARIILLTSINSSPSLVLWIALHLKL